ALLAEMVLAVVLARMLGAKGYGLYVFAYSLTRTLAIPAQAGLPTLTVREVAKYDATKQWGYLRGLWTRNNQAVLVLSLLIAMFGAGVSLRESSSDQEQLRTLLWALALVPATALGNIRGATLRGLGHVFQGQLPENVLRPSIFILLILIWYLV